MRIRRFATRLLLAAAIAGPAPAWALSYVMPSDLALFAQSEGVVVATVVDEDHTDWSGALPERRFVLSIDRVLVGSPRVGKVEMRLPGSDGRGDKRVFLPGVPEPSVGDRVLVFYASDAKGRLRPLHLGLGLFHQLIQNDGIRLWQRQAVDATDYGKGTSLWQLPRLADGFEHWIAGGGKGPSSYLWAVKGGEQAHAKFALVRDAGGIPTRWFEFDNGVTVEWRAVVGGQVGATYNVDSRVAEGIDAWNSDSASKILMSYNPARVASDPGVGSANGVNAITWDDPGNNIGGSYNCTAGGTLALSGQFFSASTRNFDGSSYHSAIEGFVITEDNSACFLNGNGGVNAAEVFAHEFGHTLGFGHPCGDAGQADCVPGTAADDATMRQRMHQDGRGGSLELDDRAVALKVYPSPSYVHPQETQVAGVSGGSQRDPDPNPQGSNNASSSGDGRYTVFQSDSTLPGYLDTNGASDIYVVDNVTGCVRRASVDGLETCPGPGKAAQKGAQNSSPSIEPSVSASGEWVAFVTETAAPLKSRNETVEQRKQRMSGKTTGWSVWMRNMLTGTTDRVATGSSTGTGTQPQVSADGQTVVFVSDTLPPSLENSNGGTFDAAPDVFSAKPVAGSPGNFAIECVSCKTANGQAVGAPAVNADGTVVAYGQGTAMQLNNLLTGTVQSAGTAAPGARPSLDYSGTQLVFASNDPLQADDSNGQPDVYLYQLNGSLTRVSKPDEELPDPGLQKPSKQPVISGDGRKIAFVSDAQNLMGYTPENNSFDNVYVYDVRERIKRRLSRTLGGAQSNGASARPFLDYSGKTLVFDSAASNLEGADSNGVQDVFQRANPLSEFSLFNSGFD